MRFTSIFLAAGLAVFASAQSTTESAAATTVDAATAAANSAQAEMLRCLEACDVNDVNCKAKCIAVPSPNEQQVNATTTCVAACDKGEGSEADIAAYSRCVETCIGENYFTPTAGTPSPTGGAAGGDSNNNGDDNNGDNNDNNGGDNNGNNDGDSPSGTENGQESGTETGPAPTESTGAAAVMGVSGGVVGMVGFVAAVMAL